ncbi:hypothetical protein GCM10027176_86770 [Actinoallomurus bryophytorum]|uniref:CU044_5270 family protein n=1 Tax=Actinoallomurus bryophytorum TaxID=1490222 RepID=A0A543CMP7_9ACTN|nr:CU044_5270 family protein [Actinoallomurus bryophytorum]TQL98388.1 hypothetical protein FB559_4011 [Actinoallomurus bryophytorum]
MNDQEIGLVRRARPAGPRSDPAVKARAWARLHAEFDAPPARTGPRTPRRHVAWRLAAVGVVAAGTAVAVAVTQTGRSTPPMTLTPGDGRPARVLELAAQQVERQTVPRPRPDQWVYSPQLKNWAIAPGNTIGTLRGKVKVEQWWRFDGREIASSTQGSPLETQDVLRPGEKLRPRRGHGAVSGPAIWRSSPRALYDYVATLPTDPVALLAKIRHDTKDSGNGRRSFGRIEQILDDDKLVPPKTNAALYRALARIPGVTVVPGVKDLAGRPGVAVTRADQGSLQQIILDRKTYRFLGVRMTLTEDEILKGKVWRHAGEVLNDSADLDGRVVDGPGQR